MGAAAGGADVRAERVGVTPAAAALLRQLTSQHGPLMFHQSGGCCDGSSPMCFAAGTFITGSSDLHLGDLEIGTEDEPVEQTVPVWISKEQYAVWGHTHITIDVVPGRGAGFSLEGPTGNRFLIRSRLFSPEEVAELQTSAVRPG
ncbi:DUF779 domain-containing protein [Auraticoccus monumenti]|uniref:UDP-glucose 4-epimerase n=1 Tax=Auraticoccus monumenti TaxID=675864 RepID=A0A1G6TS24_9ACTN|nr:DUF779 domain-containing protein [Auraticoccus monumenti]SDD31829.1 hypothetical protein SAMN04489747_0691 [Auraticoccus monumenti]